MGFRYSKRINLGGGAGLNLSKSGVSGSYRTKYGSIGPKGFSLRTGIPGLSYRSGKGKDAAGVMVIMAVAVVGALMVWNVLLAVAWASGEAYHFFLRRKAGYQYRRALEQRTADAALPPPENSPASALENAE